MTYAFRKYLNKRGSALFMVLSLMTALMILVMAMYFSVVSSRDVQYKVFYQEQAYRSATSLSDAMVAGLKNQSWQTSGTSLLDAILALDKEGDFITTNGNDFKAFVADGTKEEQAQLGAYTATITRMKDEKFGGKTTRVFDIAITTSSGGVLDTMHTYIHIAEPDAEASQGKSNIFTSTGYVPNDVYLDGVMTYTDLFYDNAYVCVTGQSRFYSNLSCGGSLLINESGGIDPGKPLTWAIRDTFTMKANLNLGEDSSGRGLLMIGGDANFQGAVLSNADIYVRGDVYHSGTNFNNCRMFVHGEIIEGSPNVSAGLYVGADWDSNAGKNGIMTYEDMKEKLDEVTASNNYSKWEINDDDADGDYYIKELNPDASSCNPITIEFDPEHRTQLLKWKNGYELSNYFGEGQTLNYTPYVIDDIRISGWGNLGDRYCPTLIIDTGDKPDNQVIIKLNANRDYDEDGVKETFCWAPDESYKTMTVLVRGCGSVVLYLPDGVIYQAADNAVVMHESWYAVMGGTVEPYTYCDGTDGEGKCPYCEENNALGVEVVENLYTQGDNSAFGYGVNDALPYIHLDCDEECDECKYESTTTGTDKCSECQKNVKQITCEAHNMTYKFCPECHPELEPDMHNGKYYGLCNSRIERSAVKARIESSALAGWQSILSEAGDADGKWHYPNNNIFIVSCDESADIRLATGSDLNDTFDNASFWGFVYAPYMTYKGRGDGAGWPVFCGGMIVADYVIKGYNVYLSCYPDMLPEDLMNANNRNEMLEAIASKSWKIDLAGY